MKEFNNMNRINKTKEIVKRLYNVIIVAFATFSVVNLLKLSSLESVFISGLISLFYTAN